MLCPKCGRKMVNVKHFEKDRQYQFNQCDCMFVTHPKRIHFDEYRNRKDIKYDNKKN